MSNWFTDPDRLKSSQYASQKNLNARITVHEKFSTNPTDYPEWIFDRMLEDFPADANIIEFGCGNGLIWKANLHRIPSSWTITLTDLSAGMLQDARANLGDMQKRFRFEVVDIQNPPFDDQQFDAAIANFMLYHVPDRAQAIRELRRVLKADGILHAVTLGKNHMREFIELALQVIPDYKWTGNALPFNTDNAQPELEHQFAQVVAIPYPCNLHITEVDPTVAYLESSARVENVSKTNSTNSAISSTSTSTSTAHLIFRKKPCYSPRPDKQNSDAFPPCLW